jgi:hypothetical protein
LKSRKNSTGFTSIEAIIVLTLIIAGATFAIIEQRKKSRGLEDTTEFVNKCSDANCGVLEVVTSPANAIILLDGNELGSSPYLGRINPGRYSLKLLNQQFSEHFEYINIIPKDTLKLSVTLEPR